MKTQQELVSPQLLQNVLSKIGLHIALKMKNGKAVSIPKFGVFTFTPLEIDMRGTTNIEMREFQIRLPIFIIAKDFINGYKSAIINESTGQKLRAYQNSNTEGQIPLNKINFSEIAFLVGENKGLVKQTFSTIMVQIKQQARVNGQYKLQIPNLGTLHLNQNLAGVQFNPDIMFPNKTRNLQNNTHFGGNGFGPYTNNTNTQGGANLFELKLDQTKTKKYETSIATPMKSQGSIILQDGSNQKNQALKDVAEDYNGVASFKKVNFLSKTPGQQFHSKKSSISYNKPNSQMDHYQSVQNDELPKAVSKQGRATSMKKIQQLFQTYSNGIGASIFYKKNEEQAMQLMKSVYNNRERILNTYSSMPVEQQLQYEKLRETIQNLIDVDINDLKTIIFSDEVGNHNKNFFISFKEFFERLKYFINHLQNKEYDDIKSNLSNTFSGITLKSNTTFNMSKIQTGMSYLSMTGTSNGISKLTLKSLSKLLVSKRKAIQTVLEQNNLSMESVLTEQEILFYIRQVNEVNLTAENYYGLLKQYNLSKDQNSNDMDYQSTQQMTNKFKMIDLLQRAYEYLQQVKVSKEPQGLQALAQIMIRKFKDCLHMNQIAPNEIFAKYKNTQNKLSKEKFNAMIKELCQNAEIKFTQKEVDILFNQLYSRGFQSGSKIEINREIPFINFVTQLQTNDIIKDWEQLGIKKIREWIIKKNLTSDTAFEKILILNNKSTIKKEIAYEDFKKALQMENLPFTLKQIEYLFRVIDKNSDGIIDFDEWTSKIFDDYSNPIQLIRESILVNGISPDELLHQMRLRYYDEPLNYTQFSKALGYLNQQLNNVQARVLFTEIKNNLTNKVEIPNLIAYLVGDHIDNTDIKDKIYQAISKKIQEHGEDHIKDMLAEIDHMNDGMIDPNLFKLVLRKMKIDYPDIELDRFIRFLDKDPSTRRIDYMWFLNQVKKKGQPTAQSKNDLAFVLQELLDKLKRYIKQNKLTPEALIHQIGKHNKQDAHDGEDKINNEVMAEFLHQKVDKKIGLDVMQELVTYMDLDKDQNISLNDLSTCLKNIKNDKLMKQICYQMDVGVTEEKELSDSKYLEVLRQIRHEMNTKKINERQLFKIIDKNNTGFINISDFSTGLDQVIQLSQYMKEKVFQRMDSLGTGLINYSDFEQSIRKNEGTQVKLTIKDSFKWEFDVISKIQQYWRDKGMSVDDMFKIMDANYDGSVSQQDLKQFLEKAVEIKEIHPIRLTRLFKLLDQEKIGKITITDIKKLCDNSAIYNTSQFSTFGTFASSFSSIMQKKMVKIINRFIVFLQSLNSSQNVQSVRLEYDWKQSAVQQIGLQISKHFCELSDCYDGKIKSGYQLTIFIEMGSNNRITFHQFKKFVEQKNFLAGFNLSQQLYQELFAFLDPHKKGYLTYTDFQNAFGGHNSNYQAFNDLKNQLQGTFTDIKTAFDYFMCFKKSKADKRSTSRSPLRTREATYFEGISVRDQKSSSSMKRDFYTPDALKEEDFISGARSLLTSSYSEKELQQLWHIILNECKIKKAERSPLIDFNSFKKVFGNLQFFGNSSTNIFNTDKMYTNSRSFFYKSSQPLYHGYIKNRGSKRNLSELISNFQSRSNRNIQAITQANSTNDLNKQDGLMQQFKIGLKSCKGNLLKELGEISEGSGIVTHVQLRNVLKKYGLQMTSADIERLIQRLDFNGKGIVNIQQIQKIIDSNENEDLLIQRQKNKLSEILTLINKFMTSPQDAFRMPPPPFNVLKDLFDYLDTNKDLLIERQEFLKAFQDVSKATTPALSEQKKQVSSFLTPYKDKTSPNFNAYFNIAPSSSKSYQSQKISAAETPQNMQKLFANNSIYRIRGEDNMNQVIAKNRKLLIELVRKKERSIQLSTMQRTLNHQLDSEIVHKNSLIGALRQIITGQREIMMIDKLLEPFICKEGVIDLKGTELMQNGGDCFVDFGRFLQNIKERAIEKHSFPIKFDGISGSNTFFNNNRTYTPMQAKFSKNL